MRTGPTPTATGVGGGGGGRMTLPLALRACVNGANKNSAAIATIPAEIIFFMVLSSFSVLFASSLMIFIEGFLDFSTLQGSNPSNATEFQFDGIGKVPAPWAQSRDGMEAVGPPKALCQEPAGPQKMGDLEICTPLRPVWGF